MTTASAFLHEKLGVSLHPEKTRIVHITNGFEFLGYKIKRGKGLKLPAHKRTEPIRWVFMPFRGKNRWIGSRIKSAA